MGFKTDQVNPDRVAYKNAANYAGADGGEQIQAAIDDLPSKGGTVYVPSMGPDAGNDWDVNATIENSTLGEGGITLLGDTPGWAARGSGTTIQRISGNPMIQFSSEILFQFMWLHVRPGGASRGIQTARDMHVTECLFEGTHGTGETGVYSADGDVWVSDCWLERVGNYDGGEAVLFDGTDSLWVTNAKCFNNGTDVVVNGAAKWVFINNLVSNDNRWSCIRFTGANTITDGKVSNCHLENWAIDGRATPPDAIVINSNLSNFSFTNISIDGAGSTNARHGINRASGTMTDCSFWNIYGNEANLSGSIFNNILGSSNGTRTIVNGHAWNNGDPASTGDWNGEETLAVARGANIVWDDSTTPDTPYMVGADGTWQLAGHEADALTAKDTGTVDGTYGTPEADVIKNNRTRIEEIEDRLGL